jgi:exonuclease III
MLFLLMKTHSIDILCMQETKADTIHHFTRKGHLIYLSGTIAGKDHGVGFIVSPRFRPYTYNFIAHGSRLATIRIRSQPREIEIINAYAPSQREQPEEDIQRKRTFWKLAEQIMGDVPNTVIPVFGGDINARFSDRPDCKYM